MVAGGESNSLNPSLFLGPNTLALLQVDDASAIEIITPWYRGGAETYVTDFQLGRDTAKQHLIAKACIKFGPREAMSEWLDRRNLLLKNGVAFPELILVDGALLIEEFIPYGFKEAYQVGNNQEQVELRARFIDTYKRIVGAGFSPVSVHDLRSRGDDVVVIDVGEDLGAPKSIDYCDLSVTLKAEKNFRRMIE